MLRRRHAAPAGFTLIELLVVIAIIIVLIGLLLPAVQRIRIVGKRAQANNEISQITNAATAFKGDWGQTPPTTFCVPQRPSGNTGAYGPLQDTSYLFLKQKYPRWPATTDASGNIIYDSSMTAFIGQPLQGNQSMVFFLGGPNLTGWAHDQPAAPSANATAKMTYLEISVAKLNTSGTIAATAYGYPSAAPVYMDPFGVPYAYFGSNKIGGKYTGQPTFNSAFPGVAGTQAVNPYMESANKTVNENGCQTISAGENKQFGAGGVWTPGAGVYAPGAAGADDMANFNGGLMLGVKP